jgi:hypothetical protein
VRLSTAPSQASFARVTLSVRLVCAVLVAAAVLVADASTVRGGALVFGVLLVWMPLCRFPLRALLRLLGLGAILFATTWVTLALAAWSGEGQASLGLAGNLAFKGLAVALLVWSTLLTYRLGDFLKSLSALPGATLMEQILQQTLSLLDESRRISQAWVLRGAAGRASLALLRATPVVWLPRVAQRAERVTAAMELRGIPSHRLFRERQPFTWRDGLGLGLSLLLLGVSVGLRGWMP